MNTKDYMEGVQRTIPAHNTKEERISNFAMGLAGEVGEVVDILKKHVYHGHKLSRKELAKEFGDVYWYLYALMDEFDIDPAVVRAMNTRKLKNRYPEGFSTEASINRSE